MFVGPEVPLIEGIVDDFEAAGIKAFGPSKAAAAQIEGSRTSPSSSWNVHSIPTAKYRTFEELNRPPAYVQEHGAPIVIKADGLAAGKGRHRRHGYRYRHQRLEGDIFVDHRFGAAGVRVVIEDFLEGQEILSGGLRPDGTELLGHAHLPGS